MLGQIKLLEERKNAVVHQLHHIYAYSSNNPKLCMMVLIKSCSLPTRQMQVELFFFHIY